MNTEPVSPGSIARAYLDTWNETDGQRRRQLLRLHWHEDAAYTDPMASVQGADPIAALIDAVHARFPGFRFTLLGTPDGHGDHVRLAWSLGPEGAPAPIEGSDVVTLDGGRIRQVIGFIDRAPAG